MALFKSILRLAVGIVASSVMLATAAEAWDGAINGNIAAMDVTAGTNLGFRISLVGVTTMCSGGQGWAYLNDTDSNYKVYVAALMLARAQGTKVTIYSTLEGGYCHIGYISLL